MTIERTPFDHAMRNVYDRALSEAGYKASKFLDMLEEQSGIVVAKQLINAQQEPYGYGQLCLRGRMDLTVEALVVENHNWRKLFEPEELARAEARLRKYGYIPKAPS